MTGHDRLSKLAAERFAGLPIVCGNSLDPGILDARDLRDWSERETTPDQRRIESYLDRFNLAGKRILHIGIGNSSLARKFGPRAGEIVGITLDDPEIARAHGLGLPNYRVLQRNKYAGLGADIEGLFDFIIDNNINSACCCLSHLLALLADYRDRLAPGGQILTDREGLAWIPEVPPANPRWRFTLGDLACAGELAGFVTEPIGNQLGALSRGDRARPTATSRAASLLRRPTGALSRRLRRLRARLTGR